VFSGGDEGQFRIERITAIAGETLPDAARLHVAQAQEGPWPAFSLRGVVSNERYLTRVEKTALVAVQQPVGGQAARRGAFIPIRKSRAWWDLTQDERRQILEEKSHHIQIGMRALPQVARRLHHCRDLGTPEPFDFLTWFDYRPEDEPLFDDLLGALRATEEWTYVEREVEVRVSRG
jgi:chlorite dismutase